MALSIFAETSENNGNFDNMLNLALDATAGERARSENLDVGYNKADQLWTVIIKYTGEFTALLDLLPGTYGVELLYGYAVLRISESQMEALGNLAEVDYVEKPRRLFFAIEQGIQSSCIRPVYVSPFSLSGRGCLVAVIDSGIDWKHKDFRNPDGTTRILYLWDQSLEVISGEKSPERYGFGVEYDKEQIDAALFRDAMVRSRDVSGHGTLVAGIAAGNGTESNGKYRGVAFESSLLVVKLGFPGENDFPRTTELMTAVDYVLRKAVELKLPVAINISVGNNYGSHSGNSLLETYLTEVSGYGKSAIVIGTGNEGTSRGHFHGKIESGETQTVELLVAEYETTLSVQIWKNYVDIIGIRIIPPNGEQIGIITEKSGAQRLVFNETELLIYYGEPTPYSQNQEIYIDFLPLEKYVTSGSWRIELLSERSVWGEYDMWLPSIAVLGQGTGFANPSSDTTLTIPSTANKVIAVGAYDAFFDQYAPFSGRGYTSQTNLVKPDLVAPGVDITGPAVGGGYRTQSGTSMAAPFVTGSVALMMQWGILQGNDPYLYGEKAKAYLIRGAKRIQGEQYYPNPRTGWGALCLSDSLKR